MSMIQNILLEKASDAVHHLFGQAVQPGLLTIQKTRPEFEGDFTLVVFPVTRFSRKSPEETAEAIGKFMVDQMVDIQSYNVVKGFLNIIIRNEYWINFFQAGCTDVSFGICSQKSGAPVVIEYSSPNTNKPLHLGHIRNNLLGWSLAEILKASGREVIKVNLVNDRGIHICKTMLAYREWSPNTDPQKKGMKGDKFVGNLYVKFEQANKAEIEKLKQPGLSEEEAYRRSPLTLKALDLLQKWEMGDPETRDLWNRMNGWVYEGFDQTYRRLGVDFDKIYHESDTYLLGKELVKEGLEKGAFYKKEDGSVWVDLRPFNLDEKLLLRSDGTSVYITQDLGTAQLRHDDFNPQELYYVVGNEQIYHFDVLKLVLKLLGREWADNILHISYGMVELPEGKMKSREGTVVDADELMEEMYETAKKTTTELGKLDNPDDTEWTELFEMLGMGALKYFILRVDPKKNMLFNPKESIDFNGNTGPFIQYTHARIKSLLRKAKSRGFESAHIDPLKIPVILPLEKDILKLLHEFPDTVNEAARNLSPAVIANYCYLLAREYNQFYQEIPVLKETDEHLRGFRLGLSQFTGEVIRKGMGLLGIAVPEKM
jgi:arginyl-tRNA synthetase